MAVTANILMQARPYKITSYRRGFIMVFFNAKQLKESEDCYGLQKIRL